VHSPQAVQGIAPVPSGAGADRQRLTDRTRRGGGKSSDEGCEGKGGQRCVERVRLNNIPDRFKDDGTASLPQAQQTVKHSLPGFAGK